MQDISVMRDYIISIPAPARGATSATGCAAAQSTANFNSRPCERGDDTVELEEGGGVKISIPAPARGATKPP